MHQLLLFQRQAYYFYTKGPLKLATLPGFEPGLPESKSGVLTITLEGNKMEAYG